MKNNELKKTLGSNVLKICLLWVGLYGVVGCTSVEYVTADCDKSPQLPVGKKLYRTEMLTDTLHQKRAGASDQEFTNSCKYYYVSDDIKLQKNLSGSTKNRP
jgi:hypothetical protein